MSTGDQDTGARVPDRPKLYHIVHVDRLSSIVEAGQLWSDAEVTHRRLPGTAIGNNNIKQRRRKNVLRSHPGLHVGDCVPFYFCPRSVMLYVIHKETDHGQDPIVHLESDLRQTVAWADRRQIRWAFTHSNAGAWYFEDRCDLAKIHEIDWQAVGASDWRQCQEGKQAEFLIERCLPWCLVSRIGVRTIQTSGIASAAIQAAAHRPPVEIRRDWYYWAGGY